MKEFYEGENIVEQIATYLNIKNFKTNNEQTEEVIKELCVAKLCSVIGIRCKYNYQSKFFTFFSSLYRNLFIISYCHTFSYNKSFSLS